MYDSSNFLGTIAPASRPVGYSLGDGEPGMNLGILTSTITQQTPASAAPSSSGANTTGTKTIDYYSKDNQALIAGGMDLAQTGTQFQSAASSDVVHGDAASDQAWNQAVAQEQAKLQAKENWKKALLYGVPIFVGAGLIFAYGPQIWDQVKYWTRKR